MDITRKKLENGVVCYVLPKKGYNEKLAMLAFNYGSRDIRFKTEDKITKQPYGIAHFLEHKMFEDENIDFFDCFTKLGIDLNAYTNFTTTAYYFRGCDNFEKGLSLLFKMVGSLYLTDENIKKEKGIIEQEIKMYEDDPYWEIHFNTLKALYKENPCRESIAGSVESVESIVSDMLEKAYGSFYTADNCALIVAGDIEAEAVYEQAEKELKLNKGSGEKIYYENECCRPKDIKVRMSVDKPIYNIGFRQNTDRPYEERLCIGNIIMNILTAKSSKLRERLYKSGLADSSFGFENVAGNDFGASVIKGEGSEYEKIALKLTEEIQHFVAYGISSEYVKRLADMEKAKMIFDSQDIYALAANVADCFAKGVEMLDIYDYYDKIDVDNILRHMSDYREDNMALSVIGS